MRQRDEIGIATGIHHGVPMDNYVADPCPEPSLSASTIHRLISRSALAAWKGHPRLGGESNWSRASDIGSAAHSLVLEGADIIQVVAKAEKADGEEIVPKAWNTKSAKAARDRIHAAGKIPMLPHETADIYAMAKKAGEALRGVGEGKPEITLIWQELNGIWCRCRADWIPDDPTGPAVDYKTTKRSAEPGEWIRRSLFVLGYDISAAWYLRGLEKLGAPRPEYRFLVQEQDPPFDYSWVGLEAGCEAIDEANKWIRKAIEVWAECLKSGSWPGYRKHVHYADPPAWRAVQIEESELAEEMARETFGSDAEKESIDDL